MPNLVIGALIGSATTAAILTWVEWRKINSIYDEARATCDRLIETLRTKVDDE